MDFFLKYRSRMIITAYQDWISKTDSVLDIGCGNAVVSDELRQYFGCSITGVDILDYRKRDILFQHLSAPDKLPFRNKEFRISMFNDVLHHCQYWQKMIEEAFRVSERILIFEMESTRIAKILDLLVNLIHNSKMNRVINGKSSQEWKLCLRRLGFIADYRQVKKPAIIYPFSNFAFNVINQRP